MTGHPHETSDANSRLRNADGPIVKVLEILVSLAYVVYDAVTQDPPGTGTTALIVVTCLGEVVLIYQECRTVYKYGGRKVRTMSPEPSPYTPNPNPATLRVYSDDEDAEPKEAKEEKKKKKKKKKADRDEDEAEAGKAKDKDDKKKKNEDSDDEDAEIEVEKQRLVEEAAVYVRIVGAVEEDGSTPKTIANGDYAKTGDVANGRAVYVKVADAARGMWYDTGGKWNCGTMKNVGKPIGYACVKTAAASPERAAGAVWRVSMGAGKWVDQTGVVVTAVTEADEKEEKKKAKDKDDKKKKKKEDSDDEDAVLKEENPLGNLEM